LGLFDRLLQIVTAKTTARRTKQTQRKNLEPGSAKLRPVIANLALRGNLPYYPSFTAGLHKIRVPNHDFIASQTSLH
jgi:hypothetical protein